MWEMATISTIPKLSWLFLLTAGQKLKGSNDILAVWEVTESMTFYKVNTIYDPKES